MLSQVGKLFKLFLLSLFLTSVTYADRLIIEPEDGRTPLLNAIRDTHSNIDLVMYGFTDPIFATELTQAANNGKNVRILLEKSPYKNEHENERIISLLHSSSVFLHYPSHHFTLTHQKTFLFDHKSALIMTFNLTHASFKNERNVALFITDPDMIQEIENVFNADWKHAPISVHQKNVVWSPDNAREKIIHLIKNARAFIQIYAQDISDYETIGALANAARSGINVNILTSSKKHPQRFNYLKRAGVHIRWSTHYLIHAKVIIIDKKQALIGSINLTQASFEKNRELSVITEDTSVISSLLQLFENDWKST
jgi:phosphatidylserine/phosphatidylglycerophosphate/cardiolipin synthase-like enzyme